jgi:hypothetical protein
MRDKAAVRAKCEEVRDQMAAAFVEDMDWAGTSANGVLTFAKVLNALSTIEWELCGVEDGDLPA